MQLTQQSERIKRVVPSSLSAETLTLCDALDDAVFLQQMISELLFNKTFSIPIDVSTNNGSLYDILHSTNAVSEKRLRVDIAMIQENILDNQATIHWLTTTEQIANVLTKDGVSSEFFFKNLNTNKLPTHDQI